jgi:hypothetical protein
MTTECQPADTAILISTGILMLSKGKPCARSEARWRERMNVYAAVSRRG